MDRARPWHSRCLAGYAGTMTTAPFEPGSDPAINPGDDPDAPDPVAPGEPTRPEPERSGR